MRIVIGSLVALLLSTAPAAGEPGGARPPAVAKPDSIVNLAQADQAALEKLPGIGPAKSKLILEYRRLHGFKKIEDLTKVRGIGRKTLARLRTMITLPIPMTPGQQSPK